MFSVWLSSGIIPAAVAELKGLFEPLTFFLEILLCFLLLTLSCFADEYGDLKSGVDGVGRLGPIRPLQREEIQPATMLKACFLLAGLSFLVGVLLITWSFVRLQTRPWTFIFFLLVGIVCILAAFGYTMGKRPYGYNGLGDLVAFFFFGPVAGLGGYWLYAHSISWLVLLPSSSAGFLLAQTINLQNLRDFENDKTHGKNTTAVKLGRGKAVVYHYLLTITSLTCYLLFPILSNIPSVNNYLFVIGFIPLISHCLRFRRIVYSNTGSEELDTLMWPLTRGMGLCSLLFCVSILL